ncbi:MAG: ComF family protein [Candidatus Omnitrophica bacterium]|nr:ComF family protein [Candidatus Omnitrophota bacterium]
MFDFGKEFNSYWRSFIRLLYPASCVLCRTPLLIEESNICRECLQKIEHLKTPFCQKCARSLPPYGNYRSICSACRSEKPYFDHGFALVPYNEPVKQILHEVKFHKKLWLLQIFKNHLKNSLFSQELSHYDLLVPVPLDWWRIRERGFNQSMVIAEMVRNINSKNKLPVLNVLKKRKRTLPQSKLRREERLANLENAFCTDASPKIRGKHILLIDDIFTTGSTINECAKVLKQYGAEPVDFFTIARAESR